MRVRISYGIEIEEVPEQVERIGQETCIDLKTVTDKLSKAIAIIEESGSDYNTVIAMFEKVRLGLTKIDLTITDLQVILEGLHNYHNGEEHVSERRPIMDPSGDTTTETKDSGEG